MGHYRDRQETIGEERKEQDQERTTSQDSELRTRVAWGTAARQSAAHKLMAPFYGLWLHFQYGLSG